MELKILIHTLIPKTYEKAMNSENADKWKDAISKELQNLYGNNDMKVMESKNIPKGLLKIMVYIKHNWSLEISPNKRC